MIMMVDGGFDNDENDDDYKGEDVIVAAVLCCPG